MKFSLDYQVFSNDQALASSTLRNNLNDHRAIFADIDALEGVLCIQAEGRQLPADYSEPLVRLVAQWLSKVPWVISGDTETIAFKNSPECYAFVPTGDGVELSLYTGDELEIEDYLFEPTIVRLELFVEQSLQVGEALLGVLQATNPEALDSHEDCRDLVLSLSEAKNAWKSYQRSSNLLR